MPNVILVLKDTDALCLTDMLHKARQAGAWNHAEYHSIAHELEEQIGERFEENASAEELAAKQPSLGF